jgi:hypothetical protein
MAAATVKHLFTGGNTGVLYTDRRNFYLDPNNFSELFKDETPFLWLAMKNRQGGLSDPVFKMFQYENTFMRRYFYNNGTVGETIAAASAGAAAESNAITIDNVTGFGSTSTIDASMVGKEFEVYDSSWTSNPATATFKGVVVLTDDTSTTTAKFKNTTGTAITTADNDVFVLISNAQEDGGEAPDAYSSELSVVWNQCQRFKTPVQIEGDLYYASLKGANNELARLRAEKAKEHKVEIEGAFLKGYSPLGTNLAGTDTFTYLDAFTGDNGKVTRTTMGIIPAIRTYGSTTGQYQNRFTITEADYKFSNFVDDTEKIFQYNPPGGVLPAVCGAGAMGYWSKLLYARSSKDNWTVQFSGNKMSSFGINVRELETPNGVLQLMRSDSLKFEYNNTMVIVDDRYSKYMEFRPTTFQTNIKTDNAYDGEKDLYDTEAGLGLTHIKTHSMITIQ